MTAVDQLLRARRELEALAQMLREALVRVEETRRMIDAMTDEEGTE